MKKKVMESTNLHDLLTHMVWNTYNNIQHNTRNTTKYTQCHSYLHTNTQKI